ncbi:MAG TPA: hypothetical protein PK640_20245 [Verrucomicrobiota bacterium]|nr:hypothetical protein [Verrucomicrobiota bacterium]
MSGYRQAAGPTKQQSGPRQRTPISIVLRWKSSGTYFAQVRVGGKLFRESLKTGVFTVAILHLADFIQEKRTDCGAETRADDGRMTFGEALAVYRQRLEGART